MSDVSALPADVNVYKSVPSTKWLLGLKVQEHSSGALLPHACVVLVVLSFALSPSK